MAVATTEYGLFISGESVEPASGDFRDLTDPATGAPLARAAMANEEDVDRAVEARDARGIPLDEERDRLDEPEAVQPVRALI